MITIKNVASRAKVSIGTVSNVLSGKRPTSVEARRRVLQAIEELGYQPNLVAHSLVTGRSGILGVVVEDFTFEELLTTIDNEATRMGYSLLVSKLDSAGDVQEQIQSLLRRRVDGILWCIPEHTDAHARMSKLSSIHGTPIALAFNTPGPGYSSVWVDNFTGGCQATSHLIEHGCRRIAHISGPTNLRETQDRKAGWEHALTQAGLEPCSIVTGGWNVKSGWLAAQKLLDQWHDCDAIFVAADRPALGAINYIQSIGRQVPGDIKVIGFDDVIELDYYHPPLTTIHQDYTLIGESLLKEISRRIEDPTAEPQAITLPTHLVIRQSCGCPPPCAAKA